MKLHPHTKAILIAERRASQGGQRERFVRRLALALLRLSDPALSPSVEPVHQGGRTPPPVGALAAGGETGGFPPFPASSLNPGGPARVPGRRLEEV